MRKHPLETGLGWYCDVENRLHVVRRLREDRDVEGLVMILTQPCQGSAMQTTVRKAARSALNRIEREMGGAR
jgi:hypothetical protein